MLDIKEKHRKILSVVGSTGSGKSHLIKTFVYNIKRVIILDSQGEYFHKDFKIFVTLEDFINDITEDGNNKIYQAILNFEEPSEYEVAIGIVDMSTKFTLMIEEVHQYAKAREISTHLEKAIRTGRHRATSLIMTTQRFGDLHMLVRNESNGFVIFKMSVPNDLKYMSEIPCIGKENSDKISNLDAEKYEKMIFIN